MANIDAGLMSPSNDLIEVLGPGSLMELGKAERKEQDGTMARDTEGEDISR